MSYNHQEVDYWLNPPAGAVLSGGAADPIANVVALRVGYQPVMAIAVYALITVTVTVVAPTITFKFRPTLGSATGEVVIGVLTIPIGTVAGIMVFKTVDNVKCLPSGEIIASTNGAATAGSAQVGILLAPNWDSPGNNLKMLRSA